MIVLVHNTVKKNRRGSSVGQATPVLVYRVSRKFSNVSFHIDIRTINLYLDAHEIPNQNIFVTRANP